ncbi:MAG: methyl-accepting chemotaxis protein [Deltaproteobacteria bacterium HGW-Deltaproteobacteria-8]|nr:MAG: methyl-accepting chemotaxis protein [Deltaproteobacteria bacterium HGW-Deltaproteobacteria-8]
MKPSLSARLFCVALAGAVLTAAASLWASHAAWPWLAWVTALALSLATGAAVWAASRGLLTDATARMTAFARRLGGGDLDAVVGEDLPADMAPLGRTLNAMAAELKKTLGFAEGVLGCLSESYPYLALDATGHISHMSPILISLLDLDGNETDFAGKTPGEVFFHDANRSTTSLEALKQNKKIERETKLTTVKNNKRILRVSANPLRDNDGQVLGSMTIYFDLTQIRAQEEALASHAQTTKQLVQESLGISAEVTMASEELAVRITGANDDAKRLLEYAGESATAMEEMNSTVLEVARNSTEAASMAKGASDKATEGTQTLESLVARIAAVDAVIGDLKARVHKLDSQADDIGKIIYVINDIADQTNLLALNAAIEAARAGDAGRGFAVVADEVRKLAEKTMSATGEVGSVISGIQESVKSAAAEMEEVSKGISEVTEQASVSGSSLTGILDLAEQTSGQVHAIAAAAEEQSAAVSQINRTVEETNNIAVHTTASMSNAALSILAMSGRASDLRRLIEGITDDASSRDLTALGAEASQECWEFKRCGREKGGAKAAEMGICPAWPEHGKDCAIVQGTLCGGIVQGDYASKIAQCAKCDYFKSEHHRRDLAVSAAKGNGNGNGTGKTAPASGGAGAGRKKPMQAAQRKTLRQ